MSNRTKHIDLDPIRLRVAALVSDVGAVVSHLDQADEGVGPATLKAELDSACDCADIVVARAAEIAEALAKIAGQPTKPDLDAAADETLDLHRSALKELLVTAESLYVHHLTDPRMEHTAIRERLGRINTLLGRAPGCGPRALWDVYEAAAKKGAAS